jgi:hypothetical protein
MDLLNIPTDAFDSCSLAVLQYLMLISKFSFALINHLISIYNRSISCELPHVAI